MSPILPWNTKNNIVENDIKWEHMENPCQIVRMENDRDISAWVKESKWMDSHGY